MGWVEPCSARPRARNQWSPDLANQSANSKRRKGEGSAQAPSPTQSSRSASTFGRRGLEKIAPATRRVSKRKTRTRSHGNGKSCVDVNAQQREIGLKWQNADVSARADMGNEVTTRCEWVQKKSSEAVKADVPVSVGGGYKPEATRFCIPVSVGGGAEPEATEFCKIGFRASVLVFLDSSDDCLDKRQCNTK
ncbi:hypothetical protein JB92DRAFT_2839115 [Gautieria morchelliformis]|nr:hypothetical protein JB92DRAFT_2839115 [Gautieria morchelliformis]